ncbi:restriction endonuclease subunit S [Ralstonia nicotianae]|nr:restriction endonuclease subunit S [Ralstonia pseudosolanacearum]
MARKPGYKETRIGWIPNEWEPKTLADCAVVTMGQSPSGDTYNADGIGTPLLNGPTEFTERHPIKIQWTTSPTKLCQPGDILICVRGSSTGRMNIANDEYCIGRGLASIRYRAGYSQAFLIHLLNHSVSTILKSAVGSTFPSIDGKAISSISVPTPSLPEQKEIAAVLTAVDDKLDVIARQIEVTRTLKRGLMQMLFNRGAGTQDADGQWVPHAKFKESELGKIPASWDVKPLGDLIEKLMDFRGRTPKKLGLNWGGGDIPALSANNVRMGYIDFSRECYLGSEELYRAWMLQGDAKKHDLVFTMEAPLGNVAVVPDDRKYILSQRVVLIRPNVHASYRFLFQYMRSDMFAAMLDKNSTGTTAKGIQQKRLVQLPVLVPSLDEQERIAGVLGSVDEKLHALSARHSHYQTMKRGLMQKLLTGEWRVKLESAELLAA